MLIRSGALPAVDALIRKPPSTTTGGDLRGRDQKPLPTKVLPRYSGKARRAATYHDEHPFVGVRFGRLKTRLDQPLGHRALGLPTGGGSERAPVLLAQMHLRGALISAWVHSSHAPEIHLPQTGRPAARQGHGVS
jgi:hypothetical protein